MTTKKEKEVLARKVTEAELLEGKTIQKVLWRTSNVYLLFTDNTWAHIDAYDYYGSTELVLSESKHENLYAWKELGLLTEEELKENSDAKDRAWKAMQERDDKKRYQELKKKFEKK